MARFPTDFYSHILWEPLFPGLGLQTGEPLCGTRTPLSSGGESEAVLLLSVLHQHALVRGRPVSHLPPPIDLDVTFYLYVL